MASVPNQQRSAVDRAVDLFTSMRAAGSELTVAMIASIADDHGLENGQLFEALSFLEANGLIGVRTVVVVRGLDGGCQ